MALDDVLFDAAREMREYVRDGRVDDRFADQVNVLIVAMESLSLLIGARPYHPTSDEIAWHKQHAAQEYNRPRMKP